MAITPHHKPQVATSIDTYASQYVPFPFEMAQKAIQNRQDDYDQNLANANAIKLKLHVDARDKDVAGRDERIKYYQDQLDTMVDEAGGDYSLLTGNIQAMAVEADADLKRGKLAQYQKEYDERKAYEDSVRKMVLSPNADTRISSLTGQRLLDTEEAEYQGIAQGSTFAAPEIAAEIDIPGKVGNMLQKAKPDMVASGGWQLDPNNNQYFTMYGTEKKYFTDADAIKVTENFLKSNPMIEAQLEQYKRIGQEDYAAQLQENIKEMVGNVFGFKQESKKWDIKANSAKTGAGRQYDPNLSYMTYHTSSTSKLLDPTKLKESVTTLEDGMTNVDKAIADTEKLPPSNKRDSDLKTLKAQKSNLEFEKNRTIEIMSGLAEAADYDWNNEYKSFVWDQIGKEMGILYLGPDATKKDGTKQYTDAQIKQAEEIEKRVNTQYDLDTFKYLVTSEGYMAATPTGVDYSEREFRDTNFDYNGLKTYIENYNESIDNAIAEGKEVTTNNEYVIGGSKTVAHNLDNVMTDLLTQNAPEFLNASLGGKQFNKEDYEEIDWAKGSSKILKHPIGGKPAIQYTVKNKSNKVDKDGKSTTMVLVPSSKNSSMWNQFEEIAYDIFQNSNALAPGVKKENLETAAFLLGSKYYSDKILESHLPILASDKTQKMELQPGVFINITPVDGAAGRSYNVNLEDAEGNTEAILEEETLYKAPEDIIKALGHRRYMDSFADAQSKVDTEQNNRN